MGMVSKVAFGVAMSAGAVAGGFTGNVLTDNPDRAAARQTVDGLMNEAHGAHLSILEQAPEGSCEQNILHYIISQDHQTEFPQSEDEVSGDLEVACGVTSVDHAQLGATAFAGLERVKELRDDITEAQERLDKGSDKDVNTIGGAAIGWFAVLFVGMGVYVTKLQRGIGR